MKQTDQPFTVKRVVRFGDCDPAGVIYTPRALDFALEAMEAWYRDVAGASWASLPATYDMAVPTVHYEADHMTILRADTEYEIRLFVSRIGQASISFAIEGVGLDGTLYFRMKVISCFISLAREERKSAPIPATIRARIQAYQEKTGVGTAN